MKDNKYKYSAVLVFNPKTESENIEKIIKKISSFLEDKSAKIEKKEAMGLKELVYPVGGFRKGNFQVLEVGGERPVKLNDLNIFLNRETNVIRYLILKK